MKSNLFRVTFLFTSAFALCLSSVGFSTAREGDKIPFRLQQKKAGEGLSPEAVAEQVEVKLFESTNEERGEKKLSPLKQEEIFVKAARDHSRDMLRRNYLSHFSPEGKSVVDRVAKYRSKPRRSLGENLHTISSSQELVDPQAISAQMMQDWMHSTPHRKNILSKDYVLLGVGCASDGHTIFCTQVFAGENR